VFQRFGGQAKLGYVGIFDTALAVLTMTVASKAVKMTFCSKGCLESQKVEKHCPTAYLVKRELIPENDGELDAVGQEQRHDVPLLGPEGLERCSETF